MDFVSVFPTEVTELIFDYLRAEDLLSCAKCCKTWRKTANSDKFWYKFCIQKECADEVDRTSCQHLRNDLYLKDPEGKSCLQIPFDTELDPLCAWRVYYSECVLMWKRWCSGTYVLREIPHPDMAKKDQCMMRYFACDGKLLAVGDWDGRVILWNVSCEAAYIVHTYQRGVDDALLSDVHLHQNHLLVERGKILQVYGITNLRGVDQSSTLYELDMESFLKYSSPETFGTVQERVRQLTGSQLWELVDKFYVAFEDGIMALSRHVTSYVHTFRISNGECIQSIPLPGSWCCMGKMLFFHGDLYIPTLSVLGEPKGSVLVRNFKEGSWKTVAECSDIPINVTVNEKIIVVRTLSRWMQLWDRKEDERVPVKWWMFSRDDDLLLYDTKLVYLEYGRINIRDTASKETDTITLWKTQWNPLGPRLVKGRGSLVVTTGEYKRYLQMCDIDTRALMGSSTPFNGKTNLGFLWSDGTKIIVIPELIGYQNSIVILDFRFNSCQGD